MTFDIRNKKLEQFQKACALYVDLNFYLLDNINEVQRIKRTSMLKSTDNIIERYMEHHPDTNIHTLYVHASSPPYILKYINFCDDSVLANLYGTEFRYTHNLTLIMKDRLQFKPLGSMTYEEQKLMNELQQDDFLPLDLDEWTDEHYVYYKLKYYTGNETNVV